MHGNDTWFLIMAKVTEDERWTAVLLPPSSTPVVDDTVVETEKDTAKETHISESEKSSETVGQFISRLGLNREEADVVEDLLKTHDFVKEKDLIENVIRASKE